MRRLIAGAGLAIALAAAPATASFADTAVHVGGVVSSPASFTVDQLKRQFAASLAQVHYTLKGKDHVSTCVALLDIIKASGGQTAVKEDPTADPKTKNMPLRSAVVVQGSDGYSVVLSLPELMPAFGNEKAYLAIDEDGLPIMDREGPVRLIIPADSKPGRWVRGVSSVSIVDMATVR